MAAVIKLCGGVRGFVLACALLLVSIGCGVQSWRLGNAQEKRDETLVEVGRWKEINKTNYDNVKRLLRVVDIWKNKSDAALAREALAVQALEARNARLQTDNRRVQQERATLYKEDANVSQWGADVVPSALYDSLRAEIERYQDGSR